MQNNVIVVDSMMGSGKSSWSIQFMNQRIGMGKYIYITPYLAEIDRIITAVDMEICQPEHKGTSKENNLCKLVDMNKNIASTHELFKNLNDESIKLIRDKGYTLILDEVLEIIEPIQIKKDSVKILIESNCISIDKEGFVHWNPEKLDYDTDFNEIKDLAEKNRLICINEALLIWQAPPELFRVFKKVYVLTYMFESSVLYYYFKLHKIEYEKKSVVCKDDKYILVDYFKADTSVYAQYIDIYEGKMLDNFEQSENALSKSWFGTEKNKESIVVLKHNLNNYLRNINKAKNDSIMWCTYKDYAKKIDGAGYKYKDISEHPEYKGKTCFVPCNCRATNDYANRDILAYMVNIYMHPALVLFFRERGIIVNQDDYALSELIQWMWRSAIRTGGNIHIYIPSYRMRRLLCMWLGQECKITKHMKKKVYHKERDN